MTDFLFIAYPWIKALHIMAVISWMAGLFYLPRVMVYHVERAETGDVLDVTFQIMESKLLRVIMNPAMILSWVLGLWLLHQNPELLVMPWMWIKFSCVVMMTASHMVFAHMRRQLEQDIALSEKAYRWWNEVPTILMIIIVIMAVVEPI